MSNPELMQKHALECLRLESHCMQLAGDSHNPNVQSHFVRMARLWSGMAVSGWRADVGPDLAVTRTRTT